MKDRFVSLQDKVVIVTGGSRGIGFATVQGFLRQGAKVALLGSRKETVEKALKQLRAEDRTYPVKGYDPDLLDEEACSEMLADVKNSFGSVDILINNAGISDALPIEQYDDAHFMKVMSINVDGVFRLTRLCVPYFKETGKGVVINTSSMVSLYAQRCGSAYPTSKFAVNGMTKALARELGPAGIRVNAIAPGIIATDMVRALDQSIMQAMSANIPLLRVGEPADIANAMLFLASDLAAYINGAILSVDGGYVG